MAIIFSQQNKKNKKKKKKKKSSYIHNTRNPFIKVSLCLSFVCKKGTSISLRKQLCFNL